MASSLPVTASDRPLLSGSSRSRAFEDDDLWCFAEIPAQGLGRLP